jgi:hypothetical protein
MNETDSSRTLTPCNNGATCPWRRSKTRVLGPYKWKCRPRFRLCPPSRRLETVEGPSHSSVVYMDSGRPALRGYDVQHGLSLCCTTLRFHAPVRDQCRVAFASPACIDLYSSVFLRFIQSKQNKGMFGSS